VEKYVGKGSPLFVEGRLQFSTWEANDGQKRSKLEVTVEKFQFLGGRDSAGGGKSASTPDRYDDVPL